MALDYDILFYFNRAQTFVFEHAGAIVAALERPGFIEASISGGIKPLAEVAIGIMIGAGFDGPFFDGLPRSQSGGIGGEELVHALRPATQYAAQHFLALEGGADPAAPRAGGDEHEQRMCAVTHLLTAAVCDDSQMLELPLWARCTPSSAGCSAQAAQLAHGLGRPGVVS